MFWIVLGLGIVLFGYGYTNFMETKKRIIIGKKKHLSLLGIAIMLFSCFAVVGANKVGVMYDPLGGGIKDNLLQEGIKIKAPWVTVYQMSTEIMEMNFNKVTVQTADSQWVDTMLQVQVQINKDSAFEYFKKYRNKSFDDIKSIIQSTVQQQLETHSTKYNIMEILGSKRNEIISKSLETVKEELEKDGIIVQRLVLVDTEAGVTIENAIANEAAAKKEAETAKYKKEKAELEGHAKVIEARKQKEANDLLSKSLTDQILTEQFIAKWDGKLPVVTGGENVFDITSIIGKN